MQRLFDLNIEQVLENWSVADALREIIANALDEQVLSGTDPIHIFKDQDSIFHIRDFGRGIQYYHFTQNENEEKQKSNNLIGKFGVGLKDALAVLYRHNCEVKICSKYNFITTKMARKSGFDIETLHAEFSTTNNREMIGTEFFISNISDDDIQEAKSRFLTFNNLQRLESNKYGEIYSCPDGNASIYINGVKVAQENNFMFNYNITSINAQIRKSLNRERSNVGRTAYSDTVKKILESCKSDNVLMPLVKDLQNRMKGTNKDETAWVDVAAYAAETLNQSNNVIFMTPQTRNDLTNQQAEILKRSGKTLVLVTDDVFKKINKSITTFDDIYKDYNKSFQYKFVSYDSLTENEKKVFDLKDEIIQFLKNSFSCCEDILISETIRISLDGSDTKGVHENDRIIIKRSVLSDPIDFCGVLAHELCHHQHGYEDNTRDFENDLTDMLGYSIYQTIATRQPAQKQNIIKRFFKK